MDEHEILTDGLNSDFWRWLQAQKDREWGVGGQRYHQAVTRAAEKADAESATFLRMVLFAKTEIDRLFAAPQERLTTLRHGRDTTTTTSRRGPGL
jgi:hypothetical protein